MKTLEVMENYLKGHKLAEKSISNYKLCFKSLANFSEEWPSKSVIIDQWITSLKLANATTRLYFTLGNSAGEYIKDNFEIPNPFTKARRIKRIKIPRVYWDQQQLLTIIKACKSDEERIIILSLLDTTCRIGEFASLETNKIGPGTIQVTGKTGIRNYRLDPSLCQKLKMMGEGNKFVFQRPDGNHINSHALENRVIRIIKRSGIKGNKLGPHTFRHSAASLIARNSKSALAVKAMLQHDDIATSMIYIHDAEASIQQETLSPLQIMNADIQENNSAMTQSGLIPLQGTTTAEETPYTAGETIDLLDLEFREIKDGTSIHSQLNTNDLRLLRRTIIGYIKTQISPVDETALKNLWNRMLRKVK